MGKDILDKIFDAVPTKAILNTKIPLFLHHGTTFEVFGINRRFDNMYLFYPYANFAAPVLLKNMASVQKLFEAMSHMMALKVTFWYTQILIALGPYIRFGWDLEDGEENCFNQNFNWEQNSHASNSEKTW